MSTSSGQPAGNAAAADTGAGPDIVAGPGAGTLAQAFSAHVGLTLDPFQVEAIEKLERSRGVLVSAPTSSGKTLIAEYAIWRCLAAPPGLRLDPARAHRVIYTTPLKALSNQKFRDLGERYGEANVGLVTGEHTLNESGAGGGDDHRDPAQHPLRRAARASTSSATSSSTRSTTSTITPAGRCGRR